VVVGFFKKQSTYIGYPVLSLRYELALCISCVFISAGTSGIILKQQRYLKMVIKIPLIFM